MEVASPILARPIIIVFCFWQTIGIGDFMATFEEQVKTLDFRAILITSVITALSFVVGLFWRDAVTDTINEIFPSGKGLIYKYLVAIAVTVFVVVISYILIKSQEISKNLLEEKLKKLKRKKLR